MNLEKGEPGGTGDVPFTMRQHSQNRTQTADQTKPKTILVGSSGKESISLKWVFRVGWRDVSWSQQQCPVSKDGP